MPNLISISTGLVYKFFRDRNVMIEKLKQFSPEGIELSFADPQYLVDFEITPSNLQYLHSLKYVSIHAPWKNIRYGNNQICEQTLATLDDLYTKVGAQNITLHATEVEDFSVLADRKATYSVENDDWRKGVNTIEGIKKILAAYPWLKFTFDFAHALTVKEKEIAVYLKTFSERLSQIHLSFLTPGRADHDFLCQHKRATLEKLIKLVGPTEKPLVLECVATREDEIKLCREEMEYLKLLLGKS